MPPEVCKGEPYGEKADIWAIGCILYELTLLKKPFDSDTISGVFNMIIHQMLEPIPDNVDTDLWVLILAMLEKDPSKRPSIWDLQSMPCINNWINQFIEEQKCADQVAMVFEYYQVNNENTPSTSKRSVFDQEKLDVMAHLIRQDIRIQEVKQGWFGQPEKCASGNDIFTWVKDHAAIDDKQSADICQKLLDAQIITRIDNVAFFEPTHNSLYKFYEDREDIADNLLRPWKQDVGNALSESVELIKLIELIYSEAI